MAGATIKLLSGATNRIVLSPKQQSQIKLIRAGVPGPLGPIGLTGPTGIQGPAGPGFAVGGTSGQILRKATNNNYDTEWATESVTSVSGKQGAVSLTKGDVGLGNVPNTDATARANHTGTQTTSTISDFSSAADARITAQKGNASGIASLDVTGKVPNSQLPPLVTNNTFVVTSQAAMLALSANVGDIAVRTDSNTNYILQSTPASTLGNWIQLVGGGAVSSVNTQIGAVVLSKTDVGLSNVDNTTDASKPVSTAQQTALNAKQDLNSDLTAIAGLAPSNNDIVQRISGSWTNRTMAQLKTALAVTKTDIGLSNVNNTADVDKPISTDTQTALDGKQTVNADLTTIASLTPVNDDVLQRKAGVWINRTPTQLKSDLTLSKTDVGLANVDNTTDIAKPVSTATQTALDTKAVDATVVHLTGNETVSGIKGFSSSPQVPTPASASDATPKNYVDSQVTAGLTPDATSSTKGKLQLTGDLMGTATAPIVKSRTITLTVGLTNADRVLSTASDYATINTAISDVSTAGGGQVVVRYGTYTPTDHIRLKSNVHLTVEKGTVFTLAQGKGIVFGNALTNVVVDGLVTDASAHVANDKSYQVDANTDIVIKNCRILNCKGFGIFVSSSGTDTAGRLLLQHNRITGLGNNDLIGGGPLNSTGAIVMDIIAEGNFVSQNSSLGNNYKFAFDIVGAYRLKFVNNNVEGGMIFGSEQSPHHHSMIQGNTIKNPNGVACAEVGFLVGSGLTNPGDGIIISNNTIENGYIIGSNSNSSPLFTNVVINGNIIDATGTSQSNGEGGIRTNNLDGVCIVGNNVHNSDSHGIWLVNTVKALVIGNVVRDSALGGVKEDTGSNNNIISLNYLTGNTSGNISSIASNTSGFANGNVNPMILYAPGNISGSVTFRRSNGHTTFATLTGNLTATLANGDVKGDTLTLLLKQDGTGGWTISWSGSNFKFSAPGNPQLDATASSITVVTFIWDGSTWNEINRTQPQSLSITASPTFAALTLTTPLSAANGGTGASAATGTAGSVVLSNSPTIVTPTIASFTNSTHNHTNAASGGQLTDAALSSAVSIAKGGTGQITATAATNALLPSQSSNSGKYLTTDGTNTSWATVTSFSNPMTTQGDIIYGGSSGAATRLAAGTSTQLLIGGTTPSWGAVALASMVSGTLPVANGGIGQTSLTSLPLTTPQVTTSVNDANGNTIIGLTPTTSSTNYLNITNATGTPILSTTGSSTNINMLLSTKGTGSVILRPGSNNTTAVQLQNAAGSTTVLDVDTSNTRVGIGKTPTVTLDVSGIIGLLAGTSTTVAKGGGSIFNHFADAGNTSTTETDLYSDSIPANALGTNGDKLEFTYGCIFVNSTSTKQLKLYFGGTAIFDTGALTISASSEITARGVIIRDSSTSIRYAISANTTGASTATYSAVGTLTGLTLSNANTMKITGTAAGVGAATNDIVAKLGTINWQSAA
jgi:hypothetical protein